MPKYPKAASCGYYVNASSDDPMLMTGYGTSSTSNETLIGRLLPLSFSTNGAMSYFNTSIMFRDVPFPILDLIYVFTPGGFNGVHANVTPVAQECDLRWCIKTVEATVRDGELYESTNDSDEDSQTAWYPWEVDWVEGEFSYNATPEIRSKSSNLTFGVASNASALQAISSFYESSRSFITATEASLAPKFRYTAEGANETLFISAETSPWWHPYNISEHFDNVARTFTNVARAASNGTDLIHGVAYGTETFVEIRWAWFSLPLLLLLLGLFFLVAVILQSRASGVQIWKTSVLAVLMHGLPEEQWTGNQTEQSSRAYHKQSAPKTPSISSNRRVLVRLSTHKVRWRLSANMSKT